MGTINHYVELFEKRDEDSYKKKFDFSFSKTVHCHCVIHADTKKDADKVAERVFLEGEDDKSWTTEVSEIYDKELKEKENGKT